MDCSLRARARYPSPAASHFSGEARRRQASRVSFRAMASAVPVEEPAAVAVAEAKPRPTGDSFIRHHLRSLSAYQPILPFEVPLQLLDLPVL
jgi:histidinol-phosphate aminotransferase